MTWFFAKVTLLAQLKYLHIVTLQATLEHVVMAQEYMEGGELQHFLAQQRSTLAITGSSELTPKRLNSLAWYFRVTSHSTQTCDFTWSTHKLALAQAVTSALAYLHALLPKVVHRDVKSRNVLLSASLNAKKLCDFSISRRNQSGNNTSSNVIAAAGTLSWTAPALLLGEACREKSDIYSLGILFSELDTCILSYHDPINQSEQLTRHPLRLMRRIVHDGLRPQLSANCPLPSTHISAACVPNARPSAADVGAWVASARDEQLLHKPSNVVQRTRDG
ncbi:hypothetical protein CCR75_001756 [Bremia lactucae]|uniref:Protein kinase domain-containing protein n=1 Tax=Bremia lactucae TaxID=4779 RepID=A0A976IHB8_BRELC|nr:hypothetical protein CCR75_001756 [Bremia lactucae]